MAQILYLTLLQAQAVVVERQIHQAMAAQAALAAVLRQILQQQAALVIRRQCLHLRVTKAVIFQILPLIMEAVAAAVLLLPEVTERQQSGEAAARALHLPFRGHR
jgi:hypothetical protein